MKTIIIIILAWCLISVIITFLYAGYKAEGREIRIEILERELAGIEKENEMLSLKLVEAGLQGWKHKVAVD